MPSFHLNQLLASSRVRARFVPAVGAACPVAVGAALAFGAPVFGAWSVFYEDSEWVSAAGSVSRIPTAGMPIGPCPPNGYWSEEGLLLDGWYSSYGLLAGEEAGNLEGTQTLAAVWGVDPATTVLATTREFVSVEFEQPCRSFAMEVATIGWVGFHLYFVDGTQGSVLFDDHPWDLAWDPVFHGVVVDKDLARIGVSLGNGAGSFPGAGDVSFVKSFAWAHPIPAPGAALICLIAGVARGLRCRCGTR